jgi:DHA1 family multidrug resistance protein-like MFS transporter
MLGLMISTYGTALMLGEFGLGRLSDRLGRKPIILLGLMLFSAQFIGLAFFRNYILIGIAFVIAGLGNALYDPALSASILDISPDEHRARILGIKSMVGSTGSILGPALVALLNSSMGARGIFLIAVGVVLLTALTWFAYQARERFLMNESGQDAHAVRIGIGKRTACFPWKAGTSK